VTSSSTHVPVAIAPTLASAVEAKVGAVFQVRPDSVQLLSATLRSVPPSGLAPVTNRRSFADCTVPATPATVNLRYDQYREPVWFLTRRFEVLRKFVVGSLSLA